MNFKSLIVYTIFFILILTASFFRLNKVTGYMTAQSEKLINIKNTFTSFKKTFSSKQQLPETILSSQGDNFSLEYTLDDELSAYIKKILKRYRSDYSSVVVIENSTGNILSAVGYTRTNNGFNRVLPFTGTHPSASLFKIITASELLENTDVENSTKFLYRGKGTTLYKYQLKNKLSRWTREQSFEKAFAKSNNVIFGKAAINNLSEEGLFKMASLFGFNRNLMKEINVSKSVFKLPETKYRLAEYAAGFNRDTTMSPLHAALLSSVVANNGILQRPKLIKKITIENGTDLWVNKTLAKEVLNEDTALKVQKMMELTIRQGTAKGSFKKLSKFVRNQVRIGGKTGSITGGFPFGKRDWFTAYAIPELSDGHNGISVCVMNINVKKWYVRSAYLAKNIIEYYFKNISSNKKKLISKRDVILKEKNSIL